MAKEDMINEKIFKAVEVGNATEVERALSEEKINTTSYYGAKSVILATENNHYDILKMLLESGVKMPRPSFWSNCYNVGFSCLSKAAHNGRTDIVKLLLDYGADAKKKDLREAFKVALLSGNMEMTKMLLDAGVNVNFKVLNDITPLMFAILFPIEKQETLVEWLVAAGAFVNVKHETRVKDGKVINTALTYAKERGYEKIVEMLKNAKKYRKE